MATSFLGFGQSYVVFGSDDGFVPVFELGDLLTGDGSEGFVLNGIDNLDNSGTSVSAAGDVNGDGLDDLIIGAPNADPNAEVFIGEPTPRVVTLRNDILVHNRSSSESSFQTCKAEIFMRIFSKLR